MSDLQKQMDKSREALVAFIEGVRKFIDGARQVALNLRNAWRARILIQQYEKEIQRVETLLKYTRHSKKRWKHERRLKWLQTELASLYEVVGENGQK
ncbi:hypothetical protein UM396_14630 [Geobacillus subterraneus]|uniref:hypothetical protein n=1 Tax=Geobacillus subterraneus TaxID=129338 RepID=UPI002AC8BF19|nr:hypothetical protein [Geobacillus subterraneus]WPZ17818.1 hypothetical protein UM396_14630 [Geobacillus subterraneus]